MMTETETDAPLMTVADVATMLNVRERWVYDACMRVNNPLPSVKVGHYRRFRKADILRWLENQRQS